MQVHEGQEHLLWLQHGLLPEAVWSPDRQSEGVPLVLRLLWHQQRFRQGGSPHQNLQKSLVGQKSFSSPFTKFNNDKFNNDNNSHYNMPTHFPPSAGLGSPALHVASSLAPRPYNRSFLCWQKSSSLALFLFLLVFHFPAIILSILVFQMVTYLLMTPTTMTTKGSSNISCPRISLFQLL